MSARQANQRFSELLGRAERGQTTLITKRGKPVAQLTPVRQTQAREATKARLMRLLEEGAALGGETFDRDALYDR